jgi:hypothetical protein
VATGDGRRATGDSPYWLLMVSRAVAGSGRHIVDPSLMLGMTAPQPATST